MYKVLKNILLFSTLTLMSCSDFLYQEPDTQISINEQFSTKEGVLQALSGTYNAIEDLLSGNLFLYADVQGGNITFSPSKSDSELKIYSLLEDTYNFDNTAENSDFNSVYTNFYKVVNQANLALEMMHLAKDLGDKEEQQIKAEFIAARGLAHFMLSLLYSQNMTFSPDGSHLGIVYNRKTLKAGVDYPKRETKSKTYQYIKEDLEQAIEMFTDKQAFDYGPDYSYFNTLTTQALLARVALDNNDWETASYYADLVISTSGKELMSKENYLNEWKKFTEPVSEILFEFSASRDKDNKIAFSISSYYNYAAGSTFDYKSNGPVASKDFLDLLEDNDIRDSLYSPFPIQTLENGVYYSPNYYFIEKFQGESGTSFIRLSEMFLIRAEALYRLSEANLTMALADLNRIRERAGLLRLSADSHLDFLEEVFLERRRELAFEGHLLFDIMRFKKNINRYQDCRSSACELNYPSPFFILPIPQKSIDINENMIQNEEYD